MQAFPDGDPYYRLESYYADIEATKLGNVKEARKVWENLLKRHGTEAEAWLRYIAFERRHGDQAGCELLFKRAAQRKLDWPERVIDAWVAFEHEEGSLESAHHALARVRRRTRDIELQRQKEVAVTTEQVAVAEEKQKKKSEKDMAYKQKKRANFYEKRAAKNEEKRKHESGSAEYEGYKKNKREEHTREAGVKHQARPAAEGEASIETSKTTLMGPPKFTPRRPAAEAEAEVPKTLMGPPMFAPRRQLQKQQLSSGQTEHYAEGETPRKGGEADEPITRRLAGQRPHAKLARGGKGGRGNGRLGRGDKVPVDEEEGKQAEPLQKKNNADFRALFLRSKE